MNVGTGNYFRRVGEERVGTLERALMKRVLEDAGIDAAQVALVTLPGIMVRIGLFRFVVGRRI